MSWLISVKNTIRIYLVFYWKNINTRAVQRAGYPLSTPVNEILLYSKESFERLIGFERF